MLYSWVKKLLEGLSLELYELSDDVQDSIDILTKADFMHACDIVDLCLHSSASATGASQLVTRGEFSTETFREFRDPLLCLFGEHDSMYVKPKIKYDYLLRTDEMNSDDAAYMIRSLSGNV